MPTLNGLADDSTSAFLSSEVPKAVSVMFMQVYLTMLTEGTMIASMPLDLAIASKL